MDALEASAKRVRMLRDKALKATDWVDEPGTSLSEEKKAEWDEYRQILRDVSLQPGFPKNVRLPHRPT